jgi:hypothetical protein
VHVTPKRAVPTTLAFADVIDQELLVGSQRSISVLSTATPATVAVEKPTAQHCVDVHVAPVNTSNTLSVALGELTIVQELPSQCSIRLFIPVLLDVSDPPTAQQSEVDRHVTL